MSKIDSVVRVLDEMRIHIHNIKGLPPVAVTCLDDCIDRAKAARICEVEAKTPDYLVMLPDLTGKTYPAIAFKHIAKAADELVKNDWRSIATDGFVLQSRPEPDGSIVVQVREEAEMLRKAAVLGKIHESGGVGADPGSYADGWDKAIDQAYNDVEQMEGVQA